MKWMITTPVGQKFFFRSMRTLVTFIKESGVNGLIEELSNDYVSEEIDVFRRNRPEGSGSAKEEMNKVILDALLKIE